jgi:uncharacterized membrane protein
MSLDFAVARYDGDTTAVKRYSAAREHAGKDATWVGEVGFVEHRHSGRMALRGTFAGHYVDVDESDHLSQKGAGEGAVTGGVIGVLGGPPGIALGLLLGGIIGGEAGRPDETEAEPEALVEQLRAAVPESSSAVVLIASSADVDEMIAALGEGAKQVDRRTLTAAEQAELEASLSAAPPTSPER